MSRTTTTKIPAKAIVQTSKALQRSEDRSVPSESNSITNRRGPSSSSLAMNSYPYSDGVDSDPNVTDPKRAGTEVHLFCHTYVALIIIHKIDL